MLDFDNIDEWFPELFDVLCPCMPKSIEQKFLLANPQYIEDARDLLFDLTDREVVINTMLIWFRSKEIVAYHGTRLIESEITSLKTIGLVPLKAHNRRDRLIRALSSHPGWPEAVAKLDATLQSYGQHRIAGQREGQVHLTLSKSGLVNGFNHYLIYGSEFDQHVAYELLGIEGKDLLAHAGEPRVVKLAVPGNVALDAAHPFFSIDDIRARGEIPNIIREFITSWSFRLAHPGFQSQQLKIDCGLIFYNIVPADWIVSIDPI